MTITVNQILNCLFTLTITTISITCYFAIKQYYAKNTIHYKQICFKTRKIFSICISVLILNTTIFNLNYIAEKKGMEPNTTLEKAIEGFNKSPYQSVIPENLDELKGKLVVFYRYTCPDCHAILNDVQKLLSEYDDVYYLSSRSNEAFAIRQKFADIILVPSIMLIGTDEKPATYVASLAIKDGNSEIVVNIDELNEILNMYHKIQK